MISKKHMDQDRPVFVPIRNGKVIEGNIYVQQGKVKYVKGCAN